MPQATQRIAFPNALGLKGSNLEASFIGGPDVGAVAQQDVVHYTTFIRLPIPRGDFVDPPLVDWDAAKDRALWNILAGNSRGAGGLDWRSIAGQFDVTLPFILQQAAWLYERQLSQVRAEMKKVGNKGNSPSPLHGITMTGVVSGGAPTQSLRMRTSSNFKVRPSSSTSATQGQGLGTATTTATSRPGTARELAAGSLTSTAAPMARTDSANKITHSKPRPQTILQQHQRDSSPGISPRDTSHRATAAAPAERPSRSPSPSEDDFVNSSESSSSSSSDDNTHKLPMTRSQAFRRPPPFVRSKAPPRLADVQDTEGEDNDEEDIDDNDDDDDDSPAFLTFSS